MQSFFRITLLPVLLFIGMNFLYAQTTPAWQNVHTADGISIDYQLTECEGLSYLALRAQNNNEWPVNISFDISTLDEKGNELFIAHGQQLSLEMDQLATGSCGERNYPQLFLPLQPLFEGLTSVKITVFSL